VGLTHEEEFDGGLAEPGALWRAFSQSVNPVVVSNDDGEGIWTAFHIGNGWMISAAHVLKDALEARLLAQNWGMFEDEPIDLAQVVHHDKLDVCIFKSALYATFDFEAQRRSIHPRPKHYYGRIPLGGHYDDWIDAGMIMLSGIVIGYPPIPFASAPVPVVHDFRINAVIDRYDTKKPAFVISGVPRGGFSGAPAILSGGYLLGVVTEALVEKRGTELDSPFMNTVTLEPILEVIVKAGAKVPGVLTNGMLDFDGPEFQQDP
jgi:hypothetical protein